MIGSLQEVDVNAVDEDFRTPLGRAASVSCLDCMKELIKCGANVDGSGAVPPLAMAASEDRLEALRYSTNTERKEEIVIDN